MFSFIGSMVKSWFYSLVIRFYDWRLSASSRAEYVESLEESEDE